jgi:uncharacterized protein (UPF0332 family)
MNTLEIERISEKDIEQYKELAKKEGLLFGKGIEYYGVYSNKALLGFGGLSFKKHHAIHKCDYVFKAFRKNGVHTELTKLKNEVAFSRGVKHVEANCTPAAVKTHINLGAEVMREYKNGVVKIKYNK